MKRFLIAASIAAVLAPSLAAPSFAQDADGRGRGGRGDGQFQGRGDRGGDRGERSGGGGQRSGRGGVLVAPQPQQVQPAPAAPQVQPQVQRSDRGQRQGGQVQGRQDRSGQDRGQFQGQRQGGQFQGRQDRNDGRSLNDRNRGGFDNRQAFQGQRNERSRNDSRDFSSRRYQGAAPRGGQRFSYQGRDFYRFRTQPYSWPRGYNYNSVRWSLNQLLPSIFFSQSYYIDPYQYGLPWAEPGYQWVRVGADALLVDTYTGQIVDIAPGVFYW